MKNGMKMTESEDQVQNKQWKSSPAPWQAVSGGESKPIYIYSAYSEEDKGRFPYSNGRLIAAVFDLSSYSQDGNARLVASAPELLEAVKDALDFLKGESPDCKHVVIDKLERVKEKAEDTQKRGKINNES